jgi:ribosomal protein L21E
MKKSKGQKKIHKVMKEFSQGKLHSGGAKGSVVKSRKQAVAIAMSEAGMKKKAKKK